MTTPVDYQPHLAASQPLPVSAYHYYTPRTPSLPSASLPSHHGLQTPSKLSLTQDDLYDYTDWVPSQASWSIDNLPEILYKLRPKPNQWHTLLSSKTQPNALDSPWKGEPPLIKYAVLPDRISSNVEIWRVEAWLRMDIRITLDDIIMRMNPRFRRGKKALEQDLVAFRKDFKLTTWSRKIPSPNEPVEAPVNLNEIEKELTKIGLYPSSNSTRGITPGLINLKLGEKGGRIPVPDKYKHTSASPGPITPQKEMTRLQLSSRRGTVTPSKRSRNFEILQNEVSPTPSKRKCVSSTRPPTTQPIIIISDDEDVDMNDRPSTPTPAPVTPTPNRSKTVVTSSTPSVKTCKSTAKSRIVRLKLIKLHSTKVSQGDASTPKKQVGKPSTSLVPLTHDGVSASVTAREGEQSKPEEQEQEQNTSPLPILPSTPPSLTETPGPISMESPPPAYFNTRNTPAPNSLVTLQEPLTQAPALLPPPQAEQLHPPAPPTQTILASLDTLQSSATALKHAIVTSPPNQENLDSLYLAIEALDKLKQDLVDFAAKGLKVHRRALDEELAWLYERFGASRRNYGDDINGKGKTVN